MEALDLQVGRVLGIEQDGAQILVRGIENPARRLTSFMGPS